MSLKETILPLVEELVVEHVSNYQGMDGVQRRVKAGNAVVAALDAADAENEKLRDLLGKIEFAFSPSAKDATLANLIDAARAALEQGHD